MSTNFKQSVSGYIRQNLASIESKISVGIRHESIIEEINSNGFDIDIGTFRTCLYRARINAKNKPSVITPQMPQANAPTIKANKPIGKSISFEYDPSNINTDDLI